ncbi:MAG: hypothetical protein DRP68_05380 [Candidatus Omnitrophota bacterium]|nr:MAG: hypothetical protein DRP68_05380 [Candidatus Omnitrophota bacterium]HDN86064.1 hypothetical protein [Candidatus Omnitrophota bacterium]
MKIIGSFLFIDLLSIFLILRIIYIALKEGLISEGIKVIGSWCALFFSLQYYPLLLGGFKSKILKREYLDFFSFFIIFGGSLLFFSLLRRIITTFVKRQNNTLIENVASFLLGVIRAGILLSAFVFSFSLLLPKENIFRGSLSLKAFYRLAPRIYLYSFGVYKKLYPQAKLNKEVGRNYEVKGDLSRSNQKGD